MNQLGQLQKIITNYDTQLRDLFKQQRYQEAATLVRKLGSLTR